MKKRGTNRLRGTSRRTKSPGGDGTGDASQPSGLQMGISLYRSLIVLCILWFLPAAHGGIAVARIYHVDVHAGNDEAPGTESAPFKTIAHATSVLEPGDTARIHAGVYHEQIMGGGSGRPGAPITYEGTERDKVVLDGSVRVTDWRRAGASWTKRGLRPITHENTFVMVDERRLLKRVASLLEMAPGTFHLAADGTYTIRLWSDADPNRDRKVDVYELDMAFNAGDRWGGNARRYIVLKNLTLQKYGGHAISTDVAHPQDSDRWELAGLVVRYNYHEGVFSCLDDWHVHHCSFVRNRGHGCQLNGARVRFELNVSAQNEWFGEYEHGGCGILIGPDASATECSILNNVFRNNGDTNGYGCGVYLEGRAHGNLVERNVVSGGTHAGICFYGASHNTVRDNLMVGIAPHSTSPAAGAFVISHSLEGEPNFAEGNCIERNSVWMCPTPVACPGSVSIAEDALPNRLEENVFNGCRYLNPVRGTCGIVMRDNEFLLCPQQKSGR